MAGARLRVELGLTHERGAAVVGARGRLYEVDGVTPLAGAVNAASGGSSITYVTTGPDGRAAVGYTGTPRDFVVVGDDNGGTARKAGGSAALQPFTLAPRTHTMAPPSSETAQLDETQTWSAAQAFNGGATINGSAVATAADVAVAVAAETTNRQNADALLIPLSQKGAAFGVAPLNGGQTIDDQYIPSAIARDAEVTTVVNNAVAAEAIARDAAIAAAVAALVASAPGLLDTLDELAAALGDDPNFAATMTAALAGKQPLDADLTAIAALATTAFGRDFLVLADAAAARTKLALGSAATSSTSAFDAAGAATAAQAAAIAASQPLSSILTSIVNNGTPTSVGLALLIAANAAAARTTLGLGSAATSNTTDFDAAGAATKEAGVSTQTADYTLVLGDAGKLILLNKATAINLLIPTDASVAFPVGTRIDVIQIGVGQVTVKAVTAGTTAVLSNGVTAAQPKTRVQYSGVTLVKDAADHWYVIGDVA